MWKLDYDLMDKIDQVNFKNFEGIRCGHGLAGQHPRFQIVPGDLQQYLFDAPCFPHGYDLVQEGGEILFLFSNSYRERKDYRQWFLEMARLCPGQTILMAKEEGGFEPYDDDDKELFMTYLYQMTSLEMSANDKSIFANMLVDAYRNFLEIKSVIEEQGIEAVVTLSDNHFFDSIIIQYAKKKGLITVTAQHGIMSPYSGDISKVFLAYSESRYFMTYSEYTKQLALDAGKDEDSLIVLGMPQTLFEGNTSGCEKQEINKNNRFLVVLDAKPFYEKNIAVLKICSKAAKKLNMGFDVRPHPTDGMSILLYEGILDGFGDIITGDIDKNVFFRSYAFGVMHGSTMILEAIWEDLPVILYKTELNATFIKTGLPTFENKAEFLNQVNNLTETFSSGQLEKLKEFVCGKGEVKENYQGFFENINKSLTQSIMGDSVAFKIDVLRKKEQKIGDDNYRLREKIKRLDSKIEKERIDFIRERENYEKERIDFIRERENYEKERIDFIREREDYEKERIEFIGERESYKKEREELTKEKRQLERELKEYKKRQKKTEWQIECLKTSEAELNEIKASRMFRVVRRIWDIEAQVIPMESRRRKYVRTALRSICHPLHAREYLEEVIHHDQDRKTVRKGENTALDIEIMVRRRVRQYHSLNECERIRFPEHLEPQVSIIIPVYNQFDFTYHCIQSVVKNTLGISYEIILADDCSTDLTVDIRTVIPDLRIVRTKGNAGFLVNCKNAAKEAKGEYLLFLNNDTEVQENWLEPLVRLMNQDKSIGITGSKLVYADGSLQEAGGILWRDGSAWNYGNGQSADEPEFNYVKEVDYISGASLMIRKNLWEKIGGFDERFTPAYCEDSDLCFAVRKAGYKVVYQPLSVVVHFEGISNGTDVGSGIKKYQLENSKKLYEKWKDTLQGHYENGQHVFTARERGYGKRVILFIDHYVPHYDRDAGSKTVYQYIRLFIKKGYYVKFIGDNFYRHEPYTTTLQQLGVEVLYGNEYAVHIFDWIGQNKDSIDYVFMNRPHISKKYIDYFKEQTGVKIIYYGHDLHFLRTKREYDLTGEREKKEEAKEWKKLEMSLMKKSDISYYPSEVEIKAIHQVDPKIRVKAISAYIFDHFREDIPKDFSQRRDILFVGGFGHDPNADAVRWFAGEILTEIRKKIDITFNIAGSNPPNDILAMDGKDGICVKGFVSEEELEELYDHCRLVVVPLRYGAGIKGKVIEAIYHGTPVVTTSVGAEGIGAAEEILTVVDDEIGFAEQVISLYQDTNRLQKIQGQMQTYIREYFSAEKAWDKIREDFS